MLQLAEVVGYMHRLDPPVVHRDLKPANILVQATEYGYGVKVADFGIGGLAVRQAIEQTRRGTRREVFLASSLRGAYTPLYASPQQMRGEAPDPRDDVYALGVIWYQLLTGDLMKGRPGGRSWQRRLLDRGVPAAWLDLLLACVEDEPEDRPADAGDLAGRLKGMLTTENAAPAAATSTSAQARIAESTGFTVILEAGFPPTNKISIIKAVREVLSIGLAEGKNLVEGAPQPIGGPMPEADARAIRLKLEAAGARVTIRTDAPFHFRSGEECHDLASLIACCERHPDDAEWHLTQGHFEPWLRTAGFEGVSDFARITRRSGKSPGDCLNDFLARLRQEIRLTKPDLGEQPQANSMYGEMLGFAIVGGIVGAILGVIGSSVEQAMPVNDSKGPLALFRAVAGATGKLGPAWAGLWGLILGSSVYYMERIRKK
ncbi:MAG: ribosomal protein L7/L12 [Gemmataceae bacterium]